jgi:hypothetical protein
VADTKRLPSALAAWWTLEKAAIRTQGQYRGNLFAGFLGGLVYQGIQLIFVALLLNSFGMIGGWNFKEIGLLLGVRPCAHSIYVIPFGALLRTSSLIHNGEFDLILLRPVNHFVQIFTRQFNIMSLGDGILGLVSVTTFGALAPVDWSWENIGYLILAVIGGGLAETAIQIAIVSFSFTATVVNSIQFMADTIVTNFGVYPLAIFGKEGLLALCFAFPLGFIAYLPTAALLGRVAEVPLPEWMVWTSPLAGWLLLPPHYGCSTACHSTTPAPGHSITQRKTG